MAEEQPLPALAEMKCEDMHGALFETYSEYQEMRSAVFDAYVDVCCVEMALQSSKATIEKLFMQLYKQANLLAVWKDGRNQGEREGGRKIARERVAKGRSRRAAIKVRDAGQHWDRWGR